MHARRPPARLLACMLACVHMQGHVPRGACPEALQSANARARGHALAGTHARTHEYTGLRTRAQLHVQ
eukprot:14278583-Alexandrium_andersonii.AAC.1